MIKWVTFILEWIRFLIIFVLGFWLLTEIEQALYRSAGVQPRGSSWMPRLANVLIMLILHHNFLQFSGWFKSPANQKLSKRATVLLLRSALLLLILPVVL
ncbi:MAG: hypothetical protein K0S39_1420 [Paenibacillus sp.]|nr:hypothetical protein [Paenibacillus sp.]